MENDNYNNPFSADNAEEHDHVEAPAVEATAEPVALASGYGIPSVAEEPVQALGFTETGAIGSMAADGPKAVITQ